jgi:uncharacterized protein with beta-barrel porin domain
LVVDAGRLGENMEMVENMKQLLLALVFAALAFGQTTHKATLTWADTLNPVGTTYNVKRATGLCTGTPTFNTIATAIAVKTYEDSTVQPGPYCYVLTAVYAGVESAPSNTALANVPSFPPSGLSVAVQ